MARKTGWTDEDMAQLRAMAAAGVSSARMAIRLRRSRGAVKARAREMGITLDEVAEWHATRGTKPGAVKSGSAEAE